MQIKTPDIGVDKATVAEILVKVGDRISVDDSIVLLESDKASVEVPSTSAGVVKSIAVSEGDEVSEGQVLIEVESAESDVTPEAEAKAESVAQPKTNETKPVVEEKAATPAVATSIQIVDVKVPDIGVEKALVGEILVKVGDEIAVDDSIVVVESDKATVEVPSSVAGIVESVVVKEGDSVKEGVVLITVKTTSAAPASNTAEAKVDSAPVVASTTPSTAKVESATTQSGLVEVTIPDLGVDKATISEILVSVGDRVEKDQSLCVAESDKASVEVPSSVAGIIKAIHVELNQSVSQGTALVTIEAEGQSAPAQAPIAKSDPTKVET